MKLHLVYTIAAGAVSCLYLGPDGAKAEELFLENRNDGDFDDVRWHFDVGLANQKTTPAKDNCERGFKFKKAEAPTPDDDAEKKAAEEAKRQAAEAKKAEGEAKKKAAEEAKKAKAAK